MAISTLKTVAMTQTIALLRKYLASGTVVHMSMKGRKVACVGHQWKSPWISPSGFTDEVSIT
jgi:hypothetical protein